MMFSAIFWMVICRGCRGETGIASSALIEDMAEQAKFQDTEISQDTKCDKFDPDYKHDPCHPKPPKRVKPKWNWGIDPRTTAQDIWSLAEYIQDMALPQRHILDPTLQFKLILANTAAQFGMSTADAIKGLIDAGKAAAYLNKPPLPKEKGSKDDGDKDPECPPGDTKPQPSGPHRKYSGRVYNTSLYGSGQQYPDKEVSEVHHRLSTAQAKAHEEKPTLNTDIDKGGLEEEIFGGSDGMNIDAPDTDFQPDESWTQPDFSGGIQKDSGRSGDEEDRRPDSKVPSGVTPPHVTSVPGKTNVSEYNTLSGSIEYPLFGKLPWRLETTLALDFPERGQEMREAKICISLITTSNSACAEARVNSTYYDTHIIRPHHVSSLNSPVSHVCSGNMCSRETRAQVTTAQRKLQKGTLDLREKERRLQEMQALMRAGEEKMRKIQQLVRKTQEAKKAHIKLLSKQPKTTPLH
ncbi:hypothetical protein AAMO2058_001728000 [Amorphochlora amoebiformis]